MSRKPLTKWAQRSDKIFITIELPNAEGVEFILQPDGHFHFSATAGAGNVPYEIVIDLYDKVNVNESKSAVGLRNICYIVKKAKTKWWSRLLRLEGKPPAFLKVDWDKWIDEDDEPGNKFEDLWFRALDFLRLSMGGAEDDIEEDSADEHENDDKAEEPEAPVDPNESQDKEQDIVDVQPSEVKLPFQLNKWSHSNIQLTNKSDDQFVEFSFYNLDGYRVVPQSGILEPCTTIQIKVGRVPIELVPMLKMMESPDEFRLIITNVGRLVQTVCIKVFTPKPHGWDAMVRSVKVGNY